MSDLHLDPTRAHALIAGGDPSDDEAVHLLDCAACRRAIDPSPALDAGLDALAATPTPIREARVLAGVHQAARARERRGNLVRLAVPAAALAAACALFVAWTHQRPTSSATVTASAGARVVRKESAGGETIELDGTATFEVPKQPAGRRFRVRAGSDELEVKGTAFRVDASPTGFRAVTVESGVVEVRPKCCAVVTLRAGDAWSPPADAPSPAVSVSAVSVSGSAPGVSAPDAPAPVPVPEPPPVAATPSGTELLAQGTSAYDAGRFGAAAGLLMRAVSAEPSAAWVRDARVLAGAAQVLAVTPASIPTLGVSVASFDAAAQKASVLGDSARAKAAQVGAARRSAGDGARRRWCTLASDAGLSAAYRDEATRGCARR